MKYECNYLVQKLLIDPFKLVGFVFPIQTTWFFQELEFASSVFSLAMYAYARGWHDFSKKQFPGVTSHGQQWKTTHTRQKKSIILKGKEFSKAWGQIIKIEVSFLYFSFFILLFFSICNNCFVYLSLFIFLLSVLYSNRALEYRFKGFWTDFSSM